MNLSNFPWLGSNIRYTKSKKLFHTICDMDYFELPTKLSSDGITPGPQIRVGIFGVCTQATPNLSSPSDEILFEDVIEHSQRCVTILKQEYCCDVIIAMTHIALAKDKDLAETIPGIDLIVGGHDHDPAMFLQQKTLVVKCGQNIDYIGLVDLVVNVPLTLPLPPSYGTAAIGEFSSPRMHVNVHSSFQLISTEALKCKSSAPLPTDPAIDSIVEHYQAHPTKQQSSETDSGTILSVVETLKEPNLQSIALSTLTSDVRCSETAFACWVADAMVWYYRHASPHPIHCDFGMINGGFIRGNHEYPQGTSITIETILEEMPFPRKPTLISILGRNILKGLEEMLSVSDNPVGCYPHLSHGLRVLYDMSQPSMQRIQSCEVLETQHHPGGDLKEVEKWTPINLNHSYAMVVSDFYVYKQGDNVTGFYQQQILQETSLVIGKVVQEYFQTLKEVSVEIPGRLRRIN
jgi:2',3'-cyclic-nucleotide 2'-phosphodiesterase (5'-nucleotidase family)